MNALECYKGLRTAAEERMVDRQVDNGVTLHLSWCSQAVGAKEVVKRIKDTASEYGILNIDIKMVGCMGMCGHEPIMTVKLPGKKAVSYSRVTPDMAELIIRNHVVQGIVIKPWLIH